MEAFRDGERTYNTHHTFHSLDTREWLGAGEFLNALQDSGIYTFRVMALGDKKDTLDSDWSELSPSWTFEKASVSLGTPANLRWDGTVACWDEPEIPAENENYLQGYEVTLLADGEFVIRYNDVWGTEQDMADDMGRENTKEYSFSVCAISNTPSKVFHGEMAYADDSCRPGDASDKVSGTLDKITSGEIPMEQAPDALKENIKDVQVAMQSDPDVLAKVEALDKNDVQKAMAGKSAEPTVKKLSFLFDSLGVGAAIDVQCAEPLEGMDYYPLAFAPDHDSITGLRAELSNISTPSNASWTYSFDLELYKTTEGSARSAKGTETKVTSLRTPLKFYISMPDGFEDVANESDTLWYDEETGCIVVYTNDPGRFTVKLRRENSGSGSSGSSGGGSSRSVRVDLMNQSPEGGKWSKDGNIWHFTFKNGILAQSCWLYIGQNWYYFGSNGDMATGWFKDNLNNWYYLTPAGAGTEGTMVTGWQQIDGRCYYFNEKSDGFRGTMLSNTTTPDGYTVDGSGAWIQ